MLTVHDRVTGTSETVGAGDGRSQTQPETQLVANFGMRPKRKSRDEQNGRAKRVKISLGDAMDLGD